MISRRQAILGTCSAAVAAGAASPAMAYSCAKASRFEIFSHSLREFFVQRPKSKSFEVAFFNRLPMMTKKELLGFLQDRTYVEGVYFGQKLITRKDGKIFPDDAEVVVDRFVNYFSDFKYFKIHAYQVSRRFDHANDDALYELNCEFVLKESPQKDWARSYFGDCFMEIGRRKIYALIKSYSDGEPYAAPTKVSRLEFF